MEGKMNYNEWFELNYIDTGMFDDRLEPSYMGMQGKIDKHYKQYLRGNQEKKFCFITIQDFKQGMSSYDKLCQFGKATEYLYTDVVWWIESGKHEDDPHLHYHALGRIATKDLKGRMAPKWNQLMGTNLKGKDKNGRPFYLCKRHNESKPGKEPMPPYDTWWKEKIDYLTNESKGTHENFCDLTTNKGRGVTGVFTSIITPQ